MKKKITTVGIIIMMIALTVKSFGICPTESLNNYPGGHIWKLCFLNQDSIRITAPTGTHGLWWEHGSYVLDDSTYVIITASNQGDWVFHASGSINISFSVWFFSALPTQPTWWQDSIPKCVININEVLNAGNNHCTYNWDFGQSSSQSYTTNVWGNHSVAIVNGCGTRTLNTYIYYNNPNQAHLGNDTTFCHGNPLILSPHITNGTNTYTWWKLGTTNPIATSSPTITVDTSGIYWGYFTDIFGCDSRDTISIITPIQKVWNPCYVSFDLPSQKNDIVWPYDPGQIDIYSINIYVNNGFLVNIPYSQGHSLDMTSLPQSTSYEYTITTLGPCGESSHSILHKTICLGISQFGTDLTFSFWGYLGVTGITTYTLWGLDINGNAYFIADINASYTGYNQYIYANANQLYVKYYVSFTAPCSYKSTVKSNTTDITTGMPEIAISEDEITMGCEMKNCEAIVINISGQVMFSGNFTGYKTIPKNFTKGVYIVKVKNRNESKQTVKKFIKT